MTSDVGGAIPRGTFLRRRKRAALIYQHATIDADRHIADAMGTQLVLFWPDSFGGGDDEGDAPGSLDPTA